MKNYIKEIFPDVWNNLYLHQKLYIILPFTFEKPNKKFRRKCIVCGKSFKSKSGFCIHRGSGKPMIELANNLTGMCCSNKCFCEFCNQLGIFTEEDKNDK